jgi:hypothetical protein
VEGVSKPPLVDFEIMQEYIIPRKAFFNRYVTVNDPDGKYAILGFPVLIPHAKYKRNEFIFNFGLVMEADVDQVPFERVVRRLAVTFAEMEKQNEYLSQPGRFNDDGARRPIESLLEIIKEDLNNFGECMIPVGECAESSHIHPPCPSQIMNTSTTSHFKFCVLVLVTTTRTTTAVYYTAVFSIQSVTTFFAPTKNVSICIDLELLFFYF